MALGVEDGRERGEEGEREGGGGEGFSAPRKVLAGLLRHLSGCGTPPKTHSTQGLSPL